MRRAMHILAGFGPEEAGRYFDHPYFGQLFLSGILDLIGYPDSINPRVTEIAFLSKNFGWFQEF